VAPKRLNPDEVTLSEPLTSLPHLPSRKCVLLWSCHSFHHHSNRSYYQRLCHTSLGRNQIASINRARKGQTCACPSTFHPCAHSSSLHIPPFIFTSKHTDRSHYLLGAALFFQPLILCVTFLPHSCWSDTHTNTH
jgi:hypothetical protein